eukprot:365423-Chlamydomonas_euryale.AAC.6
MEALAVNHNDTCGERIANRPSILYTAQRIDHQRTYNMHAQSVHSTLCGRACAERGQTNATLCILACVQLAVG